MPDNVDIVRRLMPTPEVDLITDLFRRDAPEEEVVAARDAMAAAFHEDVVCVFHALSDEEYRGIDGLWEAWLDWLRPWQTYRADVREVRALSDTKVVIVARDFARRPGSASEVEMRGFAVYTFRGDKIARVDQFPDSDEIPPADEI